MAKKPTTVEELADYALITDATSYKELHEDGLSPVELAEKIILTDVTYFDDSSEDSSEDSSVSSKLHEDDLEGLGI